MQGSSRGTETSSRQGVPEESSRQEDPEESSRNGDPEESSRNRGTETSRRNGDTEAGAPTRVAQPDRYEALPGIGALPAWVWRRLPRGGRFALAMVPVVVVALILLLGPGIDESKDERSRAEAARLAQLRAERNDRIRSEQRPKFRQGAPAGTDLERRAALAKALPAAVERDAKARVATGALDGPIRSVRCEPYPRTVDRSGAHLDPGLSTGRYSCLAVTTKVEATERNEAAAIGHPYRIRVDFETGRFALCRVFGRAGEGAIGTQAVVPLPAACGG